MGKLILIIALVGIVAAVKFLPWYVSLGGAVALALFGKLLAGRVFRRLLLQPFKIKGAVLRDATLEVNDVSRVDDPHALLVDEATSVGEEPELNEDEMADLGLRHHLTVDLTIRPKPPAGNFTHWEPGELIFVTPGTDAMDFENQSDVCDVCYVRQVWIHQDGAFAVDDGFKFQGDRRIRLLLAVRPGTTRLTAQYYFEQFGEIDLRNANEPVALA